MTDKFWKVPIHGYPKPYDPWRDAGKCVFDEKIAARVCAYWEKTYTLKDGKWDGQPFVLQVWQRQMIGHIFGWKRPDGTRRFRVVFLYIPKKNGKTILGAGIGLTLLHADGENGAEIYSCASDTDQGKIVFDDAVNMVNNNKDLASRIRVYKGYKALQYIERKSYWKVLSSRAESKHGPNVHGLIVDELHTQRDNELVATLEAGTSARQQPLIIKMTTAGHAGESPCNQELEYARGVRDGGIKDPYYMPIIFDGQADDERDPKIWKDPKFWRLVNPSFGLTVGLDYFQREVQKCEVQPSHVEVVKRLHLNIQTDKAMQWLDQAAWKECGKDGVKMEGPALGGLDLSSTMDISAFSLYWPRTRSAVCWYWIPRGTVERRAEYTLWKEHNRVMVTQGDVIDYRFIRQTINLLRKKFEIRGIAYDPWNATHLMIELSEEDDLNMMEFRQGYASMNQPSKQFEAAVKGITLRHDNNPVTNWMAGNVAINTDPAGNIKPVKPSRNSLQKVDGVVAMVMAYGLSDAVETETDRSDVIITL